MKQLGISKVFATIIVAISLFTNPEYKYETEIRVYTYAAIDIETVEVNPDIPDYDRSVTEPPCIVQRQPHTIPCETMKGKPNSTWWA